MTNGTNTKTLKDQLESETAATELSAAEDSERYHGGDWWQLSDEEESVFDIDREPVPAHDDGLVKLRGFQEYCLQPVMGGGPYRASLPATSWCVAGLSLPGSQLLRNLCKPRYQSWGTVSHPLTI